MSTPNKTAKRKVSSKVKVEKKIDSSAILGVFGVNGFIRAYSKDVHGDDFKKLAEGFIAKKDEYGKKSRKMRVISNDELKVHTDEYDRKVALQEAKNRKDLKLFNELQTANPDIG